ncbi:hypothetical protein [Yeosuana marina]|uniref:hypothetical protein n=1 Tax=Yeosuana marina TaxID=1565536 RepID=UPI0030ECD3E0|tara:strand:- start:2079 stop:2819 length:741 start_codon:yes stop_codon:yes gene_type:complete
MKTQMKKAIVMVTSILLGITSYAQEDISGTISNHNPDEKLIVSYDMISRNTEQLGTIYDDGNFNIPLDENYLTTIKEKAESAKAKAPEGWEMKFNTVASTFECPGGDTQFENGEAIVAGIPTPEITNLAGESVYAMLYAVNNPDIANWLYSYGQKNSAKGYYLQWFFVEEEASAKAECTMPTYTGNDNENYNNVTILNLELQKGWNIIKYDITEVFTDVNGKITPSKTEISRIDSPPDDLQWVIVR